MLEHALQISDIRVPSPYVAQIAGVGFFVLITAAVRRDNGAITRRKTVNDGRTHTP